MLRRKVGSKKSIRWIHEDELNRFFKHGGLGYINLHGTTDKAKVGKMVTM